MVCRFGGSLVEISGTQAKTVSTQVKKVKANSCHSLQKASNFSI